MVFLVTGIRIQGLLCILFAYIFIYVTNLIGKYRTYPSFFLLSTVILCMFSIHPGNTKNETQVSGGLACIGHWMFLW